MNWPIIFGFAEQALVIAALVGAIWSAFAFVRSIYLQREHARERELQRWRKASVQEMLHGSERFLTVEEITQRLRSASFDAKVRVEKHELSAKEVRLLLIEMLESKVIEQLWGDQYGIAKLDPLVLKAEMDIRQYHLIRNAFDLISLAPGQLSTDALMRRLGEDKIREADFLLAIHELVHRKIAAIDDRGLWVPLYGALPAKGLDAMALMIPKQAEVS